MLAVHQVNVFTSMWRSGKKVLEAVMEEAKGKLTVIAHVGCNNTADSVELAAHAQSVGADAIASIPPIYFHLPEYAIAEYWNAMSAAAPDLDFVIYNIPQLAGTALSMNLLKEMLKNPNVIAVKNSSMPTQDIQMFKAEGVKERGENGFVVFNGPDEQFVSGRAIGADGGIGGTYAVMPELFVKMDQLIRENNIAEAMKIQYKARCDHLQDVRGKRKSLRSHERDFTQNVWSEAWKRQIAACTFSTGRRGCCG